MRFSHLLPLLGWVWSAPTEPIYPSIFDNPFIPSVDPAELGFLPDLPNARRAAATGKITPLNVSKCSVSVTGEGGWAFSSETQRGVLWISQGIPSPGTKNGANIYDMSLQAGAEPGIMRSMAVGSTFSVPGSIFFTTNQYLPFDSVWERQNTTDYANVSLSQNGNSIWAGIDTSNAAVTAQPQRFSAKFQMSKSQTNPPCLLYGVSNASLRVVIGDNGNVTGQIALETYPYGVAFYYARFTGLCSKTTIPFTAP